ncbi:MAG: PqqD family protein [Blastocatellia bacterium]
MAKRFVKDNRSVTRSIAGETIIVPVRSGVSDLNSIYTLNEVGTAIWQLIDGHRTAEQIVEAIADEYEVPPEQAGRDVFDYLGRLEAEGLIRQAGEDKA